MKNKIYAASTVILLILAGWMFFYNSSEDTSSSTSTSTALDMGEYQKVVLGMKGFNYYPNVIEVQKDKPVRIYLEDSVGGCYRSFTIPSFNIAKNIASSEDYVEFTPTAAGTYNFACSMNMGKGKIVVN